MRSEHGVEHLRDGALLGEGQRLDQFQLLLRKIRTPTFSF